ncbi:MAG: cysteine desulfurase [Patescibacteria group bacterium]|jgi:cysteine desulfurase/selenocysteine lyase
MKKQFPYFKSNPSSAYLDSAATSQKPKSVLAKMDAYYQKNNANTGRGVSTAGNLASQILADNRQIVADFIGAGDAKSIIFSKNCTESLNLVAFGFARNILKLGDIILVSRGVHHANLMPWQVIAKQTGAELVAIELNQFGQIDLDDLAKKLSKKVKIVAVGHVSNVLGHQNPVEQIVKMSHQFGAKVVVDGAQAVGHMPVDVTKLDADFYAFSAHKMYGPTGIGVLYGRVELLEQMSPLIYGGGMISEVTFDWFELTKLPHRFEAGTVDVAGVVGLGEAIRFINKIGLNKIQQHDRDLVDQLISNLAEIPAVEVYGKNQLSLVSFNIKNVHPHDLAHVLDENKITVRSGKHCAMPLSDHLRLPGTVRASFGIYNDSSDVDKLIAAVKTAVDKLYVK